MREGRLLERGLIREGGTYSRGVAYKKGGA